MFLGEMLCLFTFKLLYYIFKRRGVGQDILRVYFISIHLLFICSIDVYIVEIVFINEIFDSKLRTNGHEKQTMRVINHLLQQETMQTSRKMQKKNYVCAHWR